MRARPAVVDLRDVTWRWTNDPRHVDAFVAAAGLATREAAIVRREFRPPSVVIAIADSPEQVARAGAWLGDAQAVVLLRSLRSGGAIEDSLPEKWRFAVEKLPVAAQFDWRSDADCRRAVEHACALPVSPTVAIPTARTALNLPLGPWFEILGDVPLYLLSNVVGSRLHCEPGHALLHSRDGAIDLADPPPSVRLAQSDAWALPDNALVLPAFDDKALHLGRYALGADPIHPVAFRGDRMTFYWSYVGARATGFLTTLARDFPCGPAKKLYGHADNDPVQVCVAPDGSCFSARFEHDLLISDDTPLPWRDYGPVDVAFFEHDRRRAILFAQEPDGYASLAGPDLLDEDARDVAPTVVLGPTRDARYAVDLHHRALRITHASDAPHVEHIGGPDDAYALFDADHRYVRRAKGRLLGGWFAWATVVVDGRFCREELATAERIDLGPADLQIAVDPQVEAVARDAILEGRLDQAARLHDGHPCQPLGAPTYLAIPGTRNILALAGRYARVI